MDELPKVHVPEDIKMHTIHATDYPKLTLRPQPRMLHASYPKLTTTGRPAPGTKLIPGMQLPILSKHVKHPEYRG